MLFPDGTHAPIDQKSSGTAVETLGVWGCPSGEDDDQIAKMVSRSTLWTARTKNGHLAAKYAWVSYRLKLWLALHYGLATMATPLRVARAALVGLEYKMLSSLGVNRNIKRERQTIPCTFGGVGMFSLPVEQIICCLNMLVHHFDVPSVLRQKFTTSLECLQIELGTNENPLTLDYTTYECLATKCWFVWQ